LDQRETEADREGTDDYLSVNINTPRMWILSLLFAIFGSSINLFFSLRYPSVSISPIIALLVAHPLGLLWDQVFPFSAEYFVESSSRPNLSVRRGSLDESSPLLSPSSANGVAIRKGITLSRWRRLQVWLGQGRWNAREHCCVFISSNVSFGFAFATDVIQPSTVSRTKR
jgi:OPT oligopeptide transporter protein